MSQVATFALHPTIDAAALADTYRHERRMRIDPFLADDCAVLLRDHLRDRDDWRFTLKVGARAFDYDRDSLRAFGTDKLAALRKLAVPMGDSFTYSYDWIVGRLSTDQGEEGTILADFAAFIASEPVLALFRAITGRETIGFADAKASRYGPGDFLSLHHDWNKESSRLAAYVLGLTEGWRAEYGGLLLFHETDGDVQSGLVPRMNALTVFDVPQGHSVSQVATFAPAPRLSVAGWLYPPLDAPLEGDRGA